MRQLNRVRCTLLAAFCVRQRRRIIPQDIAKETKLQQRAAVLAHTHTHGGNYNRWRCARI